MIYRISNLQRFLLRWVAEKLVIQSHEHQRNITEYYKVIIREARQSFREDNKVTLDAFLDECHKKALDEVKYPPDSP